MSSHATEKHLGNLENLQHKKQQLLNTNNRHSVRIHPTQCILSTQSTNFYLHAIPLTIHTLTPSTSDCSSTTCSLCVATASWWISADVRVQDILEFDFVFYFHRNKTNLSDRDHVCNGKEIQLLEEQRTWWCWEWIRCFNFCAFFELKGRSPFFGFCERRWLERYRIQSGQAPQIGEGQKDQSLGFFPCVLTISRAETRGAPLRRPPHRPLPLLRLDRSLHRILVLFPRKDQLRSIGFHKTKELQILFYEQTPRWSSQRFWC